MSTRERDRQRRARGAVACGDREREPASSGEQTRAARRCSANACQRDQHDARARRPAAYQSRNSEASSATPPDAGESARRARHAALMPPAACAAVERVAQQHRDRHRADAAGHGRDQPRRARRAASNSTSPISPASVRFMPTSITDGALLDPVALDQPRRADGGDQHVGAAADRRRGRACASGRWSRSRWRPAAARRSACRRGPSGRRRPPRRPRARRRGGAAAPCTPLGVHGRSPGRPLASRPAEIGVRPSTSLPGSISSVSAAPSTCGGVGSCSRMPVTRRVGVELVQERARPRRGRRPARSRWSKPRMPTSARRLLLAADVDRATPGRRRPARSRARARRGRPPTHAATSSRTSARTCWAIALPSMSVRGIGAEASVPGR